MDQNKQTEEKTLSPEERLSLEEALDRLTGLLEALDGGEQSLEEAFASYKQGIELVRLCNDRIDKVEKQCRVINEDGEDYELT